MIPPLHSPIARSAARRVLRLDDPLQRPVRPRHQPPVRARIRRPHPRDRHRPARPHRRRQPPQGRRLDQRRVAVHHHHRPRAPRQRRRAISTACPVPFRSACSTPATETPGSPARTASTTAPIPGPTTATTRPAPTPPAARATCPTSARPPTPCNTFGTDDAIRVPKPAAKINTETSRDIGPSALPKSRYVKFECASHQNAAQPKSDAIRRRSTKSPSPRSTHFLFPIVSCAGRRLRAAATFGPLRKPINRHKRMPRAAQPDKRHAPCGRLRPRVTLPS